MSKMCEFGVESNINYGIPMFLHILYDAFPCESVAMRLSKAWPSSQDPHASFKHIVTDKPATAIFSEPAQVEYLRVYRAQERANK